MTDPYQILGLSREATPTEIKKAYRKLAKKYHPDSNPGKENEEKFKEVSAAYEILSDPEKKSRHDNPPGNPSQMWDWFQTMQPRARSTQVGQSLKMDLGLTLDEIFTGTTKEVILKKFVACAQCNGIGGKSATTCPECSGTGRKASVVNGGSGGAVYTTTTITPCRNCGSTGKVYDPKCSTCNGTGRVRGEEKIVVVVERGTLPGDILSFPDHGDAGPNKGRSGYLFIRIVEKGDSKYTMMGHNLASHLDVPFPHIVLGDAIEVDLIDGKGSIQINPKEIDKPIFIQGRGLFRKDGTRGDHAVVISVDIPKELTPLAIEKLKELKDLPEFRIGNDKDTVTKED